MTKKPPLLTKRQRALQELEHATRSVGHALSLLGGRTRRKPKIVTRTYIARQYLESLATRLIVTTDLVLRGDQEADILIIPKPADPRYNTEPAVWTAREDIFPRDEFEALYDKERKPEC